MGGGIASKNYNKAGIIPIALRIDFLCQTFFNKESLKDRLGSSVVEHVLGKYGVGGPIPLSGSKKLHLKKK